MLTHAATALMESSVRQIISKDSNDKTVEEWGEFEMVNTKEGKARKRKERKSSEF